HLFVPAARLARGVEDREHRARGDEPRRRAGDLDARGGARRAVAGERPLGQVRAGAGTLQGSEAARILHRAAARGGRGGPGAARAIEKLHTPGKGGIDDVAAFLKVEKSRFIKTLVYLGDGKPVVVLVRGDHDVNEIKLRKLLGVAEVVLASDTAVKEVTGAPV